MFAADRMVWAQIHKRDLDGDPEFNLSNHNHVSLVEWDIISWNNTVEHPVIGLFQFAHKLYLLTFMLQKYLVTKKKKRLSGLTILLW